VTSVTCGLTAEDRDQLRKPIRSFREAYGTTIITKQVVTSQNTVYEHKMIVIAKATVNFLDWEFCSGFSLIIHAFALQLVCVFSAILQCQ